MNYDTTYRREQFEHGFAWGSISAFLLNAHFTAPPKPQHGQNDTRGKHTPYNPNTGKTICLNWNGRWGCQRTNCNFEHVCKTCFTPSHTQAHHFTDNTIGKKLTSPQPDTAHPTINKYLPTWTHELANDDDKDFLLHGLQYGFPLIDVDPAKIKSTHSSNHKSCSQFHDKVSKRLLEEIEDGNYIQTTESAVKLISPLAAIPKPDGDVRLIHDLSYPKCNSLNDYAIKEDCRYESLTDAIDNLQPGMWMAKCDLKWAYRSMPIKPEHYQLTGLQWNFQRRPHTNNINGYRFPLWRPQKPRVF